ncbi:hypothetical protein [Amedibacillus sp. YH-ame10]
MVDFYILKIISLKKMRFFCVITPIIVIVFVLLWGFASAKIYEDRIKVYINEFNENSENISTEDLFIGLNYVSGRDKDIISYVNEGIYFSTTIIGSVLVSQAFSLTKRINDYEEEIAKIKNS